MNYEVRLSREAVKTLDRMDSKPEKRIRSQLHELSDDPLDPRLSKSLTDMEGLRSSRVGGGRILYTIDNSANAVIVLAVRPRGQAYRHLHSRTGCFKRPLSYPAGYSLSRYILRASTALLRGTQKSSGTVVRSCMQISPCRCY